MDCIKQYGLKYLYLKKCRYTIQQKIHGIKLPHVGFVCYYGIPNRRQRLRKVMYHIPIYNPFTMRHC